MPRICFFLFLFLLAIAECKSQVTEADSLRRILAQLKNDSLKADAMIALGKSLFNTDSDLGIETCIQAQELAEKINYKSGIAQSLKARGIGYYRRGNYIEAIRSWEQSKTVFEEMNDRKGVANMLSNLGVIYRDQADNEKALSLNLEALKIAEDIKDSLRIMTVLLNIGAIYGEKTSTYDKAISYFEKALPIANALNDQDAIGTIDGNLGEIHLKSGNDSLALIFLERSLTAFEGTENAPYALNLIGSVYAKQHQFEKALGIQKLALQKAEMLEAKSDMAKSLLGIGDTYRAKGDYKNAVPWYMKAETVAGEVNATVELKSVYEGLSVAFAALKDFGNAFKYQTLLIGIKDTLYNIDTDKKLGTLLFNFEIDKKENEINLLTKDKEIQEQVIQRQKLVRNGFIGGFAVVLVFAGVFLSQRNRINKARKRSEELLLNILPEETADELKATGTAKAKSFESASVLFTDFKNFTQASEKLSPEELVAEINFCYSAFDEIITRHGLEKIKTIGDAYMCAGGLPVPNSTHPFDIVAAGLEMIRFIEKNKEERIKKSMPYFELRCGIHTGPVVAGIVGIKKFAYDIWGDTVNTASRMESSGETGKVNISGATCNLVKDKFQCVYRGKIQAKNKGEIDMYFVEGALT